MQAGISQVHYYGLATQLGLMVPATEVSIGGGTDGEELENWRARLLEQTTGFIA